MKRIQIVVTIALLLATLALPTVAQQGELKLPPYKKVKLPNGLTLLLMEKRQVPLVSFSWMVRAGSVADPAGKEGVASLTAGLLRKGTTARSAEQIAEELDFIGGQLSASASADASRGSAEFMKKDIGKGLELMADVLLNPNFPPEEFAKLQKQAIDTLRASKDQPQAVINGYFLSYLYGSHPYGRPVNGDEKSLPAITRDDVASFYQANYTSGNVILAAAGDFDAAEMEKLLREKFGNWPAKTAPPLRLPEPAAAEGKRLLLVDKPDATQTFFRVGNIGIARANADRVAIDVVNTLFGGRFTSMINTELRIKSGLTYGAGSRFDERKVRGPFFINSYTRNAKTEEALDKTLEVLKRLHEKGITDEELKSVKAYIKGQFPPSIETSDQLASLLAEFEFFGLDEREINSLYAKIDVLTLADTQRIIRQYFPLDNLVFVLIGKSSEIETVVKKYAPKFDKKSISEPGF